MQTLLSAQTQYIAILDPTFTSDINIFRPTAVVAVIIALFQMLISCCCFQLEKNSLAIDNRYYIIVQN